MLIVWTCGLVDGVREFKPGPWLCLWVTSGYRITPLLTYGASPHVWLSVALVREKRIWSLQRASSWPWLFGMLFGTGSYMLTSLKGDRICSRHGALDRHSDTPENPIVAAFYVDGIMKCLKSDSRFGANVRLQVRVMLQPIFRMTVFKVVRP